MLLGAGFVGGLSGSIAGLASLTTYPALLAVGLAPVTANVTNTIALVFNSIGSVSGSRPELRGQGPRVRRLATIGVLGGTAGSVLLLTTPADTFQAVVPVLIALAALAILLTTTPEVTPDVAHRPDTRLVLLGVFLVGVYGGYFGAAAGVLMLALLLAATPDTLPRGNAAKNLVMGCVNAVAAVVFVVFGHVDWAAAGPLAVGLFVGGRLGPVVVRHSPARPIRVIIALAGLGLAIYLGVDTYG